MRYDARRCGHSDGGVTADGLGSTMQLTDASGAVTDSHAYDAFGAMTSHTGTNPQPFGYAGQQQDVGAEGGLVYLRAREYDPALGRFLTQDPLPFAQRYTYADDDPANVIDPSGLCSRRLSLGNALDCAKKAGSRATGGTEDWARSGNLGYVDLNVSGCFIVCVTGGVQWQLFTTHAAVYGGGGVGYTIGVLSGSLNYAPGQRIAEGLSCAGQVSAPAASWQTGDSGIAGGHPKEGGLFNEIGTGLGGPTVAVTCVYVKALS